VKEIEWGARIATLVIDAESTGELRAIGKRDKRFLRLCSSGRELLPYYNARFCRFSFCGRCRLLQIGYKTVQVDIIGSRTGILPEHQGYTYGVTGINQP